MSCLAVIQNENNPVIGMALHEQFRCERVKLVHMNTVQLVFFTDI